LRKLIIGIFAFMAGLIPGFFIVFNSVFSDIGGSFSERLITFLLVILAYVILGFVFGFIDRSKSWLVWVCASAPAVLILVLYSFKETSLIGLNILYACLTIGSSWLGFVLSRRIRRGD